MRLDARALMMFCRAWSAGSRNRPLGNVSARRLLHAQPLTPTAIVYSWTTAPTTTRRRPDPVGPVQLLDPPFPSAVPTGRGGRRDHAGHASGAHDPVSGGVLALREALLRPPSRVTLAWVSTRPAAGRCVLDLVKACGDDAALRGCRLSSAKETRGGIPPATGWRTAAPCNLIVA